MEGEPTPRFYFKDSYSSKMAAFHWSAWSHDNACWYERGSNGSAGDLVSSVVETLDDDTSPLKFSNLSIGFLDVLRG